MEGDPVLTGNTPTPAPARKEKLSCEFCGCQLTQGGEVLKFSDQAKEMRKSNERISELEGTITTLRDELERAKAKIPAPAGSEERSGLFL